MTVKISERHFAGQHFVLAAPKWAQWMTFLIVLGLSGAYLIGFGALSELMRKSHVEWMVWVPAPLILISLWSIFRPSFWEPWINFAADSRGVYFDLHQSRCFHVPWDRVGEITVETFLGGGPGGGSTDLIVKVKLEEKERKQLAQDVFEGSSRTQDGYTSIRVGNNARSPKKSLQQVTHLQMVYAGSKDKHVS